MRERSSTRVGPPGEPPSSLQVGELGDRLDSWKEIATYLKRDVRTVHRWEHTEGLPVHRHPHKKRGSVYAFKSELDRWWDDGRSRLVSQPDGRTLPRRWRRRGIAVSAGILLFSVAGLVFFQAGGRRRRQSVQATPTTIRSIAVLPFENLSHNPDREYFADGMTEALSTGLGKISSLRVISRTSVLHYKGTQKSLPEVARELGVDAIVEGTTLASGKRVRVTANLIYAPRDRRIWSGSYERATADILTLQDEVAAAIAREIRARVMPGKQVRSAAPHVLSPQAYEAYVKGSSILDNGTEEGAQLAIRYFRRAIELEPSFAPAYAALADAYIFMGRFGFLPPDEVFPQARTLAEKALLLDKESAEAYTSLCSIATFYDWDWRAADLACRQAIELNPNYSRARHIYAHYLLATGQFSASFQESLQYLELDPLSPTANTHLALEYDMSRQYDLAIQQARKTIELKPNFAEAYGELAWAYLASRKPREATQAAKKAVRLSGRKAIYLEILGSAYGNAGMKNRAANTLDEIKTLSHQRFVEAVQLAVVQLGLGRKDRAVELLGKALKEHDNQITYLKVFHIYDPLRLDPHFQDLVRRMNFPE